MGEHQGNLFEPQFNRSVKVQSTDHRILSNAGVILLREAEHRRGLFDAIAKDIRDPRRPDRDRYRIDELIRDEEKGSGLFTARLGVAKLCGCPVRNAPTRRMRFTMP